MDQRLERAPGAAREAIRALYRAHAQGRQMPLGHVERIARAAASRLGATAEERNVSVRLARGFYLRHQPFDADRTLLVCGGHAEGGLIDRIAEAEGRLVLHSYLGYAASAITLADRVLAAPFREEVFLLILHDLSNGSEQRVQSTDRCRRGARLVDSPTL